NTAQARQYIGRAISLNAESGIQVLQALTLATVGDNAQAQKLVNQIKQAAPLDTLIQSNWAPTIEAEIELHGGSTTKAIDLLQPATTYEFGIPPPLQLGTLYPAYVRGVAYLKAKQATQAQAEFQKVIDHRGATINFPLGSLAHLQLARTYAMAGDSA